jgi:DNA-binding MarR family transcriptional regulator
MSKNTSHILSALLELRSMLHAMEKDFGLDDLSPVELDVLLAAHAAARKTGATISSDEIRKEGLAEGIAQATFHRALKSLLQKGLLAKADGFKARHYVVSADLNDL